MHLHWARLCDRIEMFSRWAVLNDSNDLEVKHLPNIKSAEKRTRVIAKKTVENRVIKSSLKTALKKFNAAVEAGDAAAAAELYSPTVAKVDSSCSKGILHKNKANRTKAQLSKRLGTVSSK